MATIHTILQSKSIGKTLVASILVQYLREARKQKVLCVDTDSLCGSLSRFIALEAEQRNIEELAAFLSEIPQDIEQVVIDTSTAGFLPFCSHLLSGFMPALRQTNHHLHIHTVVTGGAHAIEAFNGFRSLAQNFRAIPLTVWLNPFFGPIELNGKEFEASKVYKENIAGIHALIRMPQPTSATDHNLRDMLSRHLTYREAVNARDFDIAKRSRLLRYWNETVEQLERAALCG